MAQRTMDLAADGEHADAQVRIDTELWTTGDFVAAYANRQLRPVEVVLLARYRDALGGRVLELGCGAGRLTGYLAQLGGRVLGIDISPRMIDFCRRTYPNAAFEVADVRLVKALAARGRFDAVVAGNNLIDVFGHEERERVMGDVGELLADDGVFIFSSHNLAYAPRIPGPLGAIREGGVGRVEMVRRLFRVPRWIYNRRRMRRYEIRATDYAVLNDQAHDFALLHHYTTRDAEQAELARVGLRLIECLDENGRAVTLGERAAECAELHYVARRASPG